MRKYIPNLLSLGVLALGFASLVSTLAGDFQASLCYLLLAPLVDGLAGSLAWRLNQRSAFGGELDDLANLASLSICPLIFAYEDSLDSLGRLGLYVCCFAAACSALRLSKNNEQTPEKAEYRGLPLPAFGLGVTLAVGLKLPPQALVLIIFALLFFMFSSWGYLKAPGQAGILLAMAVLLCWAAANPAPQILVLLFILVAAYSLFGHLRFVKRLKFLAPPYPRKAASAN